MWTLFKIINFIWLLSSTYAWFTTMLPLTPLLFIINVGMMVCIGMLPIEIKFDRLIGRVLLAILALVLWSIRCDGYVMGIYTFMTYLPVIMLIMLPTDYKKDLLQFITKWYSIMLGIGLLEYFVTLFAGLPSIGKFIHPTYKPYVNYIFYIKTTYDYGTFERFNAFFLEPGHQALLSTFLIIANSFKFKKNPYCIVLLLGVLFSFSLAGYLLLFTAWALFWIKNLTRAIIVGIAMTGFIIFAINWNLGNNAVNELIISRLEYDEEKGIKGNNRYYNDTDFIFQKAQKSGRSVTGIKDYVNMKLINGAGFKIYVISYGWIGVILAALFYLSVIPSRCNVRYTSIFLIVLALCFTQRSYPGWYSWLLPYVLGIYINRKPEISDKRNQEFPTNTYLE